MTTLKPKGGQVLEGVFAVNKPQWASSAGVLRDLQRHFAASPLFAPWLEATRRDMYLNCSNLRHMDTLRVKLGHGGTLDPLATGVLVVAVGRGTKQLGSFLDCTKSYECVVTFGAATDSYDAVGKVVDKAPYAHITRELVEEKLAQFQGDIMQKPSVFSALKVNGKKMYEYAREGKDIPYVAARAVTVEKLELVEWLEPGTHDFTWPTDEANDIDKQGAEQLHGIRKQDVDFHTKNAARRGGKRKQSSTPGDNVEGAEQLLGFRKQDVDLHTENAARRGGKRKRSSTPEDNVEGAGEQPKRPRTDNEPAMSGALPEPTDNLVQDASLKSEAVAVSGTEKPLVEATGNVSINEIPKQFSASNDTSVSPPAARLRMTVSSGTYVRSLCHDLGLACNSLAFMSALVRTRQGAYALDDNVLELEDLGPVPEESKISWSPKKKTSNEVAAADKTTEATTAEHEKSEPAEEASTIPVFKPWEAKLETILQDYMKNEGWKVQVLEDDEAWEKRLSEQRVTRGPFNGSRSNSSWKQHGYKNNKNPGGR